MVDFKTCEAGIIAQDPSWTALDGIVWTPWATVLFAEESAGERLFELTPTRAIRWQAWWSNAPLAHEGIAMGPKGEIFVVDEARGQTRGCGGGIYKFVPKRCGDLSEGKLYTLAVNGDTTRGEGVGHAKWIGPSTPRPHRRPAPPPGHQLPAARGRRGHREGAARRRGCSRRGPAPTRHSGPASGRIWP